MTGKKLEELKTYIRDCNYATYISLCDYAYEVTKPPYNGKPEQPYKIFDKWFKKIVLHEQTEEEKENAKKWNLKDFIKKTDE